MIANFAVTYRCDSRCQTCNIWKIQNPAEGELSLDEIRELFTKNRAFLRDVKSVQITGGEPYLRRDLPEVIETIHQTLPRCGFWIPTNGMDPGRVEEETRRISDSLGGVGLGVSVSVDGLEETHNGIRGVEGSWRRALETLRRLASLIPSYGGLGLSVGMTLTPSNYMEIAEVARIAEGFGADLSVRPMHSSNIYYRNEESPDMSHALTEITDSVRQIARVHVENRGLLGATPTLRYLSGVLDYLKDPSGRSLRCTAGEDSFFLDPYGDVYSCIMMDARLGNIRDQPLVEIWGSEQAERARERIRGLDCPRCWVECEAFRDIRRDRAGLLKTYLKALLDPENLGLG